MIWLDLVFNKKSWSIQYQKEERGVYQVVWDMKWYEFEVKEIRVSFKLRFLEI